MVLKHLFFSHLLLVTALVSTLTIMMHAIESNTSSVIGVPRSEYLRVLSHIAYADNPVAKRAALITTPLTTATHTTSQEKSKITAIQESSRRPIHDSFYHLSQRMTART